MNQSRSVTKKPNQQPAPGGELARYKEEQLSIIRNHVAGPTFTDDELAYCLSVARARGLDPLQKQVYFTKRKKKQGDSWVDAVTVEPTIDGFRVMAERTGELDGYDGPFWCGENGEWVEAWLSDKPPTAAKITVFRKGRSHGFTSVARFEAYVQTDKSNNPNHIWAKMGDNQLAKCAEALALRKAFPSQLGAFYTREEMGQVDNTDRFKDLPQESKQDAPKSKVAEKPVQQKPKLDLPALPDVVSTIPTALCLGVFKPLAAFEGVPLQDMDQPDLELVISTIKDHRAQVQNEAAKAWLTAIEAEATEILRYEDAESFSPADMDEQGAQQ